MKKLRNKMLVPRSVSFIVSLFDQLFRVLKTLKRFLYRGDQGVKSYSPFSRFLLVAAG
jgi:hypothetical protein